jgi:sugar lactone lactonase YvrE
MSVLAPVQELPAFNHPQGDQVNTTKHTATTPSRRSARAIRPVTALRFAGVAVLAAMVLLALAATSASASTHVFSTSFAGSGTAALAAPTGVAVDNSTGASTGDVYVTDPTNHRVEKFDAAGNFILMFGEQVNKSAVEEPLSTEAEQNLCTAASGDVCQPGTSGSTPGAFETPTFVSVDASSGPSAGDVYVADSADNRIAKFTPDGSLVESWGKGGQLLGNGTVAFGSLGGIAVDPDGVLVVFQSSRFFRFAEDGTLSEEFFTGFGAGPDGIAIDSKGDIYLVRPGGAVAEVSQTGTELHEALDPGPTTGIAVDPSTDDLYVDRGAEIISYDPAGSRLESFGSTHLSGAAGLAFGSTGGLYVADSVAARVAVFDLFGPFAVTSGTTSVTSTSATLDGRIAPTGAGAITKCSFEYFPDQAFDAGGFSTAKTVPCSPAPPYVSPTQVSAEISGLNGGTVYHFRITATDANTTNSSPGATFSTLGASIDWTSASTVSATAATLETEINPHNTATTYRFEYDTVPYTEGGPSHGTALPVPDGSAGAGEAGVTRTAMIQGLQSATIYHFRVIATNSLGVTTGPDHSFTTQGAAISLLPDGRGYEMVSPPNKHGIPLEGLSANGGMTQAAADGSGLAYIAFGPIDSEPQGTRSGWYSQLLARRSDSGWSTRDITVPNQVPVQAAPGQRGDYELFSPDLSSSLLTPTGGTPLSSATSEKTPYIRQSDGSYLPLVVACPAAPQPCPAAVAAQADVPPGTSFGGEEQEPELFLNAVGTVTATPDLSHVILESKKALTAEFSPGYAPTYNSPDNLYEWNAGELMLASWVPPGSATVCGGPGPACIPASEAGLQSSVGIGVALIHSRHVLAADGSRLVFRAEYESGSGLYLRDIPRGETLQLDVPKPNCLSCEGGTGVFQSASSDGSRVLFTDGSHLTRDSTAIVDKPDLYECHIMETGGHLACDLTDLTAKTTNTSEPANVRGILVAASEDASYLYFVATGVLTGSQANQAGEAAHVGQPNLYIARDGVLGFIATLSEDDTPDWGEGEADFETTARVSPDGRYFAFMSQRPLTGYDNRDVLSGQPDEEVFLYDSQASGGVGRLVCASCNPSGARPRGVVDSGVFPGPLVDHPLTWGKPTTHWLAALIPGWSRSGQVRALYQSRYLDDSGRLFFDAADALVPQDSNGVMDVYQYEPHGEGRPASNNCTTSSATYGVASGGCVSLVSSGVSPGESEFLDASESGDDVFFLTASRLVSKDVDPALDVYDARVGGGEPKLVKPPACEGDACQNPVQAPNDPTPGSLTFSGPGNLVVGGVSHPTVKKSVKCKKPRKLSHGKCVKVKSKKRASAKKARKLGYNRRAAQ